MAVSKFNDTQFFSKMIEDKVIEIKKLCEDANIPFFMCFCVENNEKKTKYKNYIHGALSSGIILTDDRITGHIGVANGFKTVPGTKGEKSIEEMIEDAESVEKIDEKEEEKGEDVVEDGEDTGFDDEE